MLILEKKWLRKIDCECLYRGSRKQNIYGLCYIHNGIHLRSWGINFLILKESETNKEIKGIQIFDYQEKR